MKLIYFPTLLLILFTSFILSIPIDHENDSEVKSKEKRYDTGLYLSSVGRYLFTKNIIRNIKYDESHDLDIYGKNTGIPKPVVIYIYGGTWHMGEKTLYTKLGDYLSENGFIGVIPNYVQFPFGTVDEMVYDIGRAIQWVYENIGRYGGDRENITVLGHSSGAHLASLTLIRTALHREANEKFPLVGLPTIRRAVFLNGVYDFDLFSSIAKMSDEPEVAQRNTLFEKFANSLLGTEDSCPTDILRQYPAKSVKSLGAERIIVVHSDQDVTVPVESTRNLVAEIQRISDNPVIPYMINGYYHCGITEGLMNGDIKVQGIIKNLLTL